MRILNTAIAATTLLAQDTAAFSFANPNSLFANRLSVRASSSSRTRLFSTETESAPSDIPTEVIAPSLVSQPNGASVLRSSAVKDINGDFIPLGRAMKKGKSIVIFLRHMG
jgi:hypothetical protein